MSTTLSITGTSPHLIDADALVVAVSRGADGPQPAPGAKDIDDALGGTLASMLAALGATGEAGEVTKIATGGRLAAPLIVAAGIGAGGGDAPVDPEVLRRAAGAAVRAVGSPRGSGPARQRRIVLALPARSQAEAEAVALGALLGGYTFGRYRSEPAGQAVLTLVASGSHAAEAARRAEVLATAVTLARDLVNTGPSDLVPATFAARAGQIAAETGIGITVLDEQALAEGGYGGILGVGQGSAHPPRLVRLEYAPPEASQVLVLAGKGITFDSGGLSLKPAKAMETMKSDMGGAAAVLASMQAISTLGLPVRVIGYLPLAENMPSGTAQRPSDVLTMYGGTTVEVLNTDAEGRLVLADALARSAADSPDVLVDIATLTGAQVVSLGPRVAGVMANDDALRDAVVDAAGRAGEAMWPMPLPDELRRGLESSVADLTNVAPDRNGGMLVAGLFLREFVPLGVRWAHLDIAGPAYNDGPPHGYTPKGGTGAATRTLVQIAQDMADGRL
ncbi:MAG TPA: leucyl aminopeptidase [Streptosporangiaceae bacterium]